MPICGFCEKRSATHNQKTLCKTCYERQRVTGSLTYARRSTYLIEEEAFFSQLKEVEGHWLWSGATDKETGYGHFSYRNTRELAHRWSFTFFLGDIPADLVLDHDCRIRLCVYPWHLNPVTQKVNILRGTGMSARNKVKTHCPQNHEYTPENTYVYRGRRQCVTCRAYHNRNRKKPSGSVS